LVGNVHRNRSVYPSSFWIADPCISIGGDHWSDAARAQSKYRSNNANERTMTNKILANMTQHLTLLKFLSTFSLWLIPALLDAGEPQIQVQQILQTTQSWDGVNYQSYPTGQPQLTVLRITVPPNTALHWHHHPVISVGYVLAGELTLEKKGTGERTIVHAGQALAETIQTTHRGFTTSEPVELVVFYAGQVGLPITINED
jgi:quercetin dioxygenase-like cupin family protein